MTEHRYILEPYKGMNTRYRCPGCNKEKTFSRYIDKETGEHFAPDVGRCNRESKCGYHYTPKQYFKDNQHLFDTPQSKQYPKSRATVTPQPKPISFIPVEVFKQSLKNYEANNFVKFLLGLFGVKITNELISHYFIATSKHWNGATVFWQIDNLGKIRTGKIMLYSSITGKRIKNPFNHITWVHKAIKQPEFELKQCLFGEHLLRAEPLKPAAIVESEKTAIIASVYLPQFIWLATGSLTNLSADKCQVLKGRTVALFPDLNGFERWINKAKELSHLARFTVSDLLERKATEAERKQDLDLADYLLRFDINEFIRPYQEPEIIPEQKTLDNIKSAPQRQLDEEQRLEIKKWNVPELEDFFKNISLPAEPVKLDQCNTITNIVKFIDSHISVSKAQNGNLIYKSYFDRLMTLKNILTVNLN